jgi:hypothetical protein
LAIEEIGIEFIPIRRRGRTRRGSTRSLICTGGKAGTGCALVGDALASRFLKWTAS